MTSQNIVDVHESLLKIVAKCFDYHGYIHDGTLLRLITPEHTIGPVNDEYFISFSDTISDVCDTFHIHLNEDDIIDKIHSFKDLCDLVTDTIKNTSNSGSSSLQ